MSPGPDTHSGGGDGGARAVAGSRAPSIPRCGVSSPFRGHLSTKSNAFCIGQSSRLSNQYRIRDHMVIHYNKILSAKAAIDCSVPKSLIKSVKYSDQQRRERMKKEVSRLERTSSHSAASSRPRSRDGADSTMHRKVRTAGPSSPLLRLSPYSDPGPLCSPSSFLSSPRHLQSPGGHTGRMQARPPEFFTLHSALSDATSWTSPCKFQDKKGKTCSGDLLEKHSHHFTSKERPFTPRTLKTQAKSALAQSRYYTPPRHKRRGAAAVAATQTDLSSFRDILQTPERDSSPITDLERNAEHFPLSDEEDFAEEQLQPSLSSELHSSSLQKLRSEEEELTYLRFVDDVTKDILTLGLFSDRVIERVFHQHLEENRHRLDEGKMRHLLDILRADLDCREETNPRSPARNLLPQRHGTNSSWFEVINGSFQEEAASDPHSIVSDHHLLVRSAPYPEEDDAHSDLTTRGTGHGDCAPLGADGIHHREDDGGDQLSPQHDGCDVHEPAADDHTDQPSDVTCLDNSEHRSNNTPDLQTLEELQQSFSDVLHVSQGNDCGVSETNDQGDL
ncbi:spermatogenesis-associated protein 7 [Anomaloglossus baeobatrachus]